MGASLFGAGQIVARPTNILTALSYGAVGDGVTDDTSELLAALSSGAVIDGLGLNYAVSGTVHPANCAGFINGTITQLNQVGTVGCCTLYISNSNCILKNIKIDRGSQVLVNASYDSNPNGALNAIFGLRIEGTYGAEISNVIVDDVEITGNGSGTGFGWANIKESSVTNVWIHDMNAKMNVTITDDIIQGFWASNVFDCVIDNIRAARLYTWTGSVYTNIWSRGIVGGNVYNCNIGTLHAVSVDQGVDLTGTGATSPPDGPRSLTITNVFADLCGAVGLKLANACHDITISSGVLSRCGWMGALVSGQTDATSAIPGYIDINNILAINIGYQTSRAIAGNGHAFYIQRQPDVNDKQPVSVRFNNCRARDNQAVPTTVTAFKNDVQPFIHPAAGYNKNNASYLTNCSADASMVFANGISSNVCALNRTTNQTLTTATLTSISWNNASDDLTGLHSSTLLGRIYIKAPGRYKIATKLNFAANATGVRLVQMFANGSIVDAATTALPGVAGSNLSVYAYFDRMCASGDFFEVFGYQTSGGNLDVVGQESFFTVTKLDD